MATELSVLVVGGGPAGLSSAISLRQHGYAVDVVEKHSLDRVQGSELMLPMMLFPTLTRLGLLDACMAEGVGGRNLLLSPAPGVQPISIPMPGTADAPDGGPTGIGISRPVLYRLLRDAAERHGARLTGNLALMGVDQDDDGVVARLSDGSSARYDLLVAADGVFSDTRRMVFPEIGDPPLTGQVAWRTRLPRVGDGCPELTAIYYGPERRKVGLINAADDCMYLFMLEPAPEGRIDPDRLSVELKARLADFGGYVAQARDRIEAGTTTYFTKLHRMLVPEPWFRGRVVLAGDAAHGVTPHLAYGAGLSIEDGVVLADCLAAADTVDKALLAYTERRFGRCRDAVEACRLLGESELDPQGVTSDPMKVNAEAWARLSQPI
ncbi:FAD-dependent monooxygenase [Streptomyces sp. NPDC091217]|uniref:FAD-dependent monooxygenase n=1 Tax=Streptomyces sp. NPDC091217 TaxID=3365975 RepID=UPI00381E758F